MKFGVLLANQFPLNERASERIDQLVEQVGVLRDNGFDLITLGHHHLAEPYQMPSSMTLLARLAAVSGQLRLGITIFLLPLHNPVDVAEQVATLDAISDGRFIFGVGLGYRPEECEAFGITLAERVPRLEESLEIMKLLWTQDEVEYQGRFYTIPKVQSTIRTAQQPHPPIWMAASGPPAIRRAGRLGLTWITDPRFTEEELRGQIPIYEKALREHGQTAPAERPFRREAWVAPTREQAWAEAGPYVGAKYQTYAAWDDDQQVAGARFTGDALEEFGRGRFLIGTPDDFIQGAERLAQLGATTLVLRIQWPGMDHQRVLDHIRFLGKEVLPACADL